MEGNKLREKYAAYLGELNIHLVRSIARQVGVNKPTDGKKDYLIERIIDVLTGIIEPVPTSRRGAPLKESEPDPKYLDELETIRKEYERELQRERELFIEFNTMSVNVPKKKSVINEAEKIYVGVLELQSNGSGLLHTEKTFTDSGKIFLSTQFIRQYDLREGDRLSCFIISQKENNTPSVKSIITVNDKPVDHCKSRKNFYDKLPQYPNKAVGFAANAKKMSLRILELFCPLGRGQRALLHVPVGCEYNAASFLREVANNISARRGIDTLKLLCLMIDESPESISEYVDGLTDEEVYYTTFDRPISEHLRMAKLAFTRAKRLAEDGMDVVLVVNSFTKLVKAQNKCCEEKPMPCGLFLDAFTEPKQYFSIARKLADGGSVTLLTAITQNAESAVDRYIEEEFTPLANAHIYFDRSFAERHITPPIDLSKSHTQREELYLSPMQLQYLSKIRPQMKEDNGESILKIMGDHIDNYSMIAKSIK